LLDIGRAGHGVREMLSHATVGVLAGLDQRIGDSGLLFHPSRTKDNSSGRGGRRARAASFKH
jgi:hypothetical protein